MALEQGAGKPAPMLITGAKKRSKKSKINKRTRKMMQRWVLQAVTKSGSGPRHFGGSCNLGLGLGLVLVLGVGLGLVFGLGPVPNLIPPKHVTDFRSWAKTMDGNNCTCSQAFRQDWNTTHPFCHTEYTFCAWGKESETKRIKRSSRLK